MRDHSIGTVVCCCRTKSLEAKTPAGDRRGPADRDVPEIEDAEDTPEPALRSCRLRKPAQELLFAGQPMCAACQAGIEMARGDHRKPRTVAQP